MWNDVKERFLLSFCFQTTLSSLANEKNAFEEYPCKKKTASNFLQKFVLIVKLLSSSPFREMAGFTTKRFTFSLWSLRRPSYCLNMFVVLLIFGRQAIVGNNIMATTHYGIAVKIIKKSLFKHHHLRAVSWSWLPLWGRTHFFYQKLINLSVCLFVCWNGVGASIRLPSLFWASYFFGWKVF